MADEGAKKAAKKGGAKKASSAKKTAAGSAKKALGAKKAVSSSARATGQPGHEAIAKRAYYIYEHDQSGDAVEHWLQAERELSDES